MEIEGSVVRKDQEDGERKGRVVNHIGIGWWMWGKLKPKEVLR